MILVLTGIHGLHVAFMLLVRDHIVLLVYVNSLFDLRLMINSSTYIFLFT